MPVSGTVYYFLIYINKDLTTFNELKTTNSAQHGTIFGLFGGRNKQVTYIKVTCTKQGSYNNDSLSTLVT